MVGGTIVSVRRRSDDGSVMVVGLRRSGRGPAAATFWQGFAGTGAAVELYDTSNLIALLSL